MSDNLGPVKKDVTEAYAEGASLTLICTATGGKPLARVSFFPLKIFVIEVLLQLDKTTFTVLFSNTEEFSMTVIFPY